MTKDANKRQEEILEIIVRQYVEAVEPVSSGFVAQRLNLSSATIRNVMADLEDRGYITHPHTSAGRIPTDAGYRYYVNVLMHKKHLNEHVIAAIEEEYRQKLQSLEDVFEKTSHLISSLTNYVGISLIPQIEKVYMDGASHLLEQPEFRDLNKLRNLFRYLEDKVHIMKLLCDEPDDDRITIHIGKENKSSSLSECSIVARSYRVKGKPSGKIGVIGPKRMVYDRVVPMVEFLADTVSGILDDMETGLP